MYIGHTFFCCHNHQNEQKMEGIVEIIVKRIVCYGAIFNAYILILKIE